MAHPLFVNIGTPESKVIEECSELIQALIKVDRFGWFSKHNEKTNIEQVRYEMQDLSDRLLELEEHLNEIEQKFPSKEYIIYTQEELDALPKEFEEKTIIKLIDFRGEIRFHRKNSVVSALDNSEVNAYNNSEVIAYNYSRVDAYDNSVVDAYDNSRVNAYNNSEVIAYDNSRVDAYDDSIVNAYNDSIVYAYGNSEVIAYGNSVVYAFDNSVVSAYIDSEIKDKRCL